MRRKNRLKILLIILISIFIMFAAPALLLASFQKSAREAQQKKEAIENAAKLTPTPEPTAIPSPSPTPRPTATPTPVPEQRVTFNPDDFWDYWYSTDGLVTINVYNVSQNAVSFSFYQTDAGQTQAVSADITAEVAGNAAAFSFGDSAGNSASGNLTFDNGQLYLRVSTAEPVSSVYPNVSCIMSRNQVILNPPEPTATPTPSEEQPQVTAESGEYFFPESSNRYLTDEEISNYTSDQLELAKNEIYARHGRQFVTDYIADYFNSKSWYQGTIDPETFDAEQGSIFNEYEIANINKIQQWEDQKVSEGN